MQDHEQDFALRPQNMARIEWYICPYDRGFLVLALRGVLATGFFSLSLESQS